jgi:hypothetical protein
MTTSTEPTMAIDALRHRSRAVLSALAVQFLLGMGANLIGDPGDSNGAGRVIGGIVLGLHILVGIGVVVGAVRVWTATRRLRLAQREGLWGLVVMAATFLIGVGTVLTGSDWLSFLMAAGFLVGAALYARTYLIGSRPARDGSSAA